MSDPVTDRAASRSSRRGATTRPTSRKAAARADQQDDGRDRADDPDRLLDLLLLAGEQRGDREAAEQVVSPEHRDRQVAERAPPGSRSRHGRRSGSRASPRSALAAARAGAVAAARKSGRPWRGIVISCSPSLGTLRCRKTWKMRSTSAPNGSLVAGSTPPARRRNSPTSCARFDSTLSSTRSSRTCRTIRTVEIPAKASSTT